MVKAVCAAICGAFVIASLLPMPARAEDDIATKAQACGVCHGPGGVPAVANIPIIWGQQSSYLYKELHDYHSGDRANPIMASVARNFTLEELRAVANYIAAKNWPAPAGGAAAPAAPPQAIADKIAMCKACHGQNFEGGAPAPRLAGLSSDYLAAAMAGFANGQRTNNLDMPGFMKALSPSERDAIAHYLSAL